ncbi:hypothetical protein WJX82_004837 [Trebouxia sp. C0006]
MLRATQDLAAGDRVTVGHMAPDIVPVKDRQHWLRLDRDTTCACPRCIVEETLPSSIQTKIHIIHARKSGLAQTSSVDDEDQHPSLPAKQVGQLLKELATDLGNTGLPMQQQHWVLFSVLGAYFYYNDSLEDNMRPGDEETDAVPMRLRQYRPRQRTGTCLSKLISLGPIVQARYGFTTADQKQRALRQALRHLTKLEIKYFTRSKQNPYAGCGKSLVQSLRDQ